ncbi:MAG: OmpA family protein, partial [Bacteroidota bacterium]
QPVKNARIKMGDANDKNFRNVYISDDGSFQVSVPKGVNFSLLVEKPGYLTEEKIVHYRKDYVYYKEKEINLEVTPLEEGTRLSLSPIYFKQSKAEVLTKSYSAMDEIADFLEENSNINIRIEGHTDNQGDVDALLKLSEERAEEVKNYLVYKKRINPLRVETIGFGASKPVTDNTTELDREKNRRVEVEIIKVYDLENSTHADKKNE